MSQESRCAIVDSLLKGALEPLERQLCNDISGIVAGSGGMRYSSVVVDQMQERARHDFERRQKLLLETWKRVLNSLGRGEKEKLLPAVLEHAAVFLTQQRHHVETEVTRVDMGHGIANAPGFLEKEEARLSEAFAAEWRLFAAEGTSRAREVWDKWAVPVIIGVLSTIIAALLLAQ